MATTESSTELRTLCNIDSTNVSDSSFRQSYLHVIDMNNTEQPLPDVVSWTTMHDEPDDHYDTIGSLPRDDQRYTIPVTSEDNSSGQYMKVYHIQPSVAPPLAPGSRQLSRKRFLFVGLVVTVIIALLTALAAVTSVLLTYQAEHKKGEDVTLPTSQSTIPRSTTMNVSEIPTSMSSTTPLLPFSTTPASTTPALATTTPASATPPGCMRKCISCTSYNTRCPANGAIVGGDPGEVIPCPCHTACFSDVRENDGYSVHRGCTRDFPEWDAAASVDLTCRKIGQHFLCFCLGDRCNTDDMTPHIP